MSSPCPNSTRTRARHRSDPNMKFAFAIPHMMRLKASVQPFESTVSGPDQLRMARRAESLGYDMIGVPEHFVVPLSHLELSGPHYFHGIAAMSAIAGATE